MKSIESRIEKLENKYMPEDLPEIRCVVIGVPPCGDTHISGATVGDKFIKRMDGETVKALTDRAAATEPGNQVIVSLKSECYDSGGAECHDIGGAECRAGFRR